MMHRHSRTLPLACCLLLLFACGTPLLAWQGDPDTDDPRLGASGDVTLASRYLWRGQRLTNAWSLQPSATLSFGALSFNAWGNLDLGAVNEGDQLPIAENPAAGAGSHHGLRGRFSEVDLTASLSHRLHQAELTAGSIFYIFPYRQASLPSTTELFAGLGFPDLPLAPSATLYIDVDETGDAGSTGCYFQTGASHAIPLRFQHLPALELGATLAWVNEGFGRYYYGSALAGAHDIHLSLTAPIVTGESSHFAFSLHYSGLLGKFRGHQYIEPRLLYLGTAPLPETLADTVWAAFSVQF